MTDVKQMAVVTVLSYQSFIHTEQKPYFLIIIQHIRFKADLG